MGDMMLAGGDVKFKWGDDCLKIYPLSEFDLYVDSKPLADINKTLFRFMDECHVDKFFSEGVLRLSNFECCGTLTDDMRRDRHEGFATLGASDGQFTIEMCVRMGMNPLMLCSTGDMNSYSGHEAGIRIFDPTGLRDAITDALKAKGRKIHQVLQGDCLYQNRMIFKKFKPGEYEFVSMLAYASNNVRALAYRDIDSFIRAVGGNLIYFMKPVDKADEKEYRMVWDCNRLESDEYEDVVISSPEKYAEKFVL